MSDISNNLNDLISQVRDVLKHRAAQERLLTYGEIETKIDLLITSGQWRTILDPIYHECISVGDPDLTLIVVRPDTMHHPFSRKSVGFSTNKHLAARSMEVQGFLCLEGTSKLDRI
jgi:hypothetical protein